MFIKLLSNRKILRKAAHEKVWPLLENAQDSDSSDPEQEFYASETSKDPGMNQFWRLLRTIDKTENPSDGYLLLMKELSSIQVHWQLCKLSKEILLVNLSNS